MTDDSNGMPQRSYGCTYGCGNPYDVIIVDVKNGTTEFLCIPCFVQLAASMIEAMTDSDAPNVVAAQNMARDNTGSQVPGPTGKSGRRNAPATNDDPEMFASYDASVDTVAEVPE